MIEVTRKQIATLQLNEVGMPTFTPVGQALSVLSSTPMAIKPKYWIGRIFNAVTSAQRDLDAKRTVLIKQFGGAVELVAPAAMPLDNGVTLDAQQGGGKWKFITDPEKLKSPNLQYMVKPENQAAFDERMAALLDERVTLPFNRISVEDMCNAKGEPVEISFDLSPVLWLFCDFDDPNLGD